MIVNYDYCIKVQRARNADERDDDIVIRQDEKLTISNATYGLFRPYHSVSSVAILLENFTS